MVIFDSTRPTVNRNRPFGIGVARPGREKRAPFTAADAEWAARELNADARDYDVIPDYDRMAAEWAAEETMGRGFAVL
jgi:hypothetical protein